MMRIDPYRIATVSMVNLNDHGIRATGQTGTGNQQPQIRVSLSGGSAFNPEAFTPGVLAFYIGTGENLYVDGVLHDDQGGTVFAYEDADEWWNDDSTPTNSDYEVMLTVESGEAPGSGAVDAWTAMDDALWDLQVQLNTDQDAFNAVWRIQIRDSASEQVLASGDMTILLDYEEAIPE